MHLNRTSEISHVNKCHNNNKIIMEIFDRMHIKPTRTQESYSDCGNAYGLV